MVGIKSNAVLTPYGRGVTPRPQISDLDRISSYGRITHQAGISVEQSRRRPKVVEKILKRKLELKIRVFDQKLGMVRFRTNLNEPTNWKVDCFGAADEISALAP